MKERLLSVRDLNVRYGKVEAVYKASLNVDRGTIVSVIGPNGAGKSTLLNALMGVLPSRGSVEFCGKDLGRINVEQRVGQGLCLVPEKRELFSQMTVADNLELGAFTRYRRGDKGIRRSLEQVYALFPHLAERRGQFAGSLSGGERQMLALGRALMSQPTLLMLDEPSLGLAPLIVKEILHAISDLRTTGVSILLIEQNARAALQISDYGYVLENGEITLEGASTELANNPQVIASYLGMGGDAGATVQTGGREMSHQTKKEVGMKQLVLGISMCAVVASASAARADLTIGVNLSSTGPAATLGMAEKNAVSLGPAVIAGQKVRYVVYDDATDTTNAVQNVKRLISEEKVDFVIGPTTSPAGLAVVSVAAEGKTAIIQLAPSPAPIAPGDQKRKWIFYGHTAADVNAKAMARHMVAHGVKRVSVISLDDAYGESCVTAYKKIAAENGFNTLTFEKYKRTDTSATGQVLHAMAGNPDAVFIATSGTPGVLPHVGLIERGYKGKIYQSGGSASAEFLRLGGKALEGSYMMGPPLLVAEQLPDDFPAKKEALEFVSAYEKKFGPRSMFAAQVWNAMRLLEATVPKAMKAGKPGTEKFRVALREAIENTHGLKGAGIVISYSPTDHTGISDLGMCVLKVEGGKWKLDQHAVYK